MRPSSWPPRSPQGWRAWRLGKAVPRGGEAENCLGDAVAADEQGTESQLEVGHCSDPQVSVPTLREHFGISVRERATLDVEHKAEVAALREAAARECAALRREVEAESSEHQQRLHAEINELRENRTQREDMTALRDDAEAAIQFETEATIQRQLQAETNESAEA